MTNGPEFPPVTMDIAQAVCQVCHWTVNISRQAYLAQDKQIMKQLDLVSQRRIDDALNEHLRSEHGLMSVLIHTSEMNDQADRSFKEGERVGKANIERSLRKVVLEAMQDAVSGMLTPEDDG